MSWLSVPFQNQNPQPFGVLLGSAHKEPKTQADIKAECQSGSQSPSCSSVYDFQSFHLVHWVRVMLNRQSGSCIMVGNVLSTVWLNRGFWFFSSVRQAFFPNYWLIFKLCYEHFYNDLFQQFSAAPATSCWTLRSFRQISKSYSFLTKAKEAVLDVRAVSGLLAQVVFKWRIAPSTLWSMMILVSQVLIISW